MTVAVFFSSLEPVEGARDALISLQHSGAEVMICSSVPWGSQTGASEKIWWVRKFLGRRFTERVILTNDKTVVGGTILVDDKPVVTGLRKHPTWQQVYFDRPYNTVAAGGNPEISRIHSWAEWPSILDLL